jgi:hypothetical protein
MAVNIHNYWLVLISRILDGILGGNISLAQAYVSGLLTAVFCFCLFLKIFIDVKTFVSRFFDIVSLHSK